MLLDHLWMYWNHWHTLEAHECTRPDPSSSDLCLRNQHKLSREECWIYINVIIIEISLAGLSRNEMLSLEPIAGSLARQWSESKDDKPLEIIISIKFRSMRQALGPCVDTCNRVCTRFVPLHDKQKHVVFSAMLFCKCSQSKDQEVIVSWFMFK